VLPGCARKGNLPCSKNPDGTFVYWTLYAPEGCMSANELLRKINAPDFSIRDEGSIVLLTPLSPSAHEFVEQRIGSDNGYQPYWPTVVIEPRYVQDILEGVIAEGMVIS
jgi:hypothetical protein